MTSNQKTARFLRRLSALLELTDAARSRTKNLRDAATKVEGRDEPLDQDALERWDVKLGEEAREQLAQYLETGTTDIFKEHGGQYPLGLLDVVDVKGIGGARARALNEELNVDGLERLIEVCRSGEATQIKGIGARSAERILEAALALQAELNQEEDAPAEEAPAVQADAEEAVAQEAALEEAAPEEEAPAEEAPAQEPAAPEAVAIEEEAAPLEEEVAIEQDAAEEPPAEEAPADQAEAEEAVAHETADAQEAPTTAAIGDDHADRIREALKQAQADEEEVEVEVVEVEAASEDVAEDAPSGQSASEYLWAHLRCAACHQIGLEEIESAAQCGNCGRRFAIEDGVIDIVGGAVTPSSPAQRLMEFDPYINVYENVGRPLLTRAVTPRSMEEAYALNTDLMDLRPGLKVLDVACGPGNFTRRFADAMRGDEGSLVVGLDMSMAMLRQAQTEQRNSGEEGTFYMRADANHLPFADGTMDRVHCSGALHLMPNPHNALREFVRVTRPGGLIVISAFERSASLADMLPKLSGPMALLLLPVLPAYFAVSTGATVADKVKDFSLKRIGIQWLDQGELRDLVQELGTEIETESQEGMEITIRARRI